MGNLKVAARSLLSTPGPTVVVLVTLAVAIGANTAIFSIVDGVLLRPLGYGDDSRLVVLWSTSSAGGADPFRLSPADYLDVRDGAAAFDGQVALYRFIGSTLTGLERPARVGSLAVTPRLFAVLNAAPAAGRLFNDRDESPGLGKKVVLTHAAWTRRFGADPSLVGSSIELDGEPYAVVGITAPGFQFPPGDDDVELYFPLLLDSSVLPDRDHRMFDAIARLAHNVPLPAAQAELDATAQQLAAEFPDTNDGWGLIARPLRRELLGDLTTTLWVLSGAVFLVLLTACANIANVLVARAVATGHELAVRAALGANASDLCKRSLAESAILGLLGGTGGVLLAVWGIRLARAVLPADIPRGDTISLNGAVLLFAAALAIGATLLFGSLPALRSMAPDLNELLKPAAAFGVWAGGGRRLRELMVVVEVALAIVLLVGAGLMVRSFARLSEVDPGYRRQGVVSVAVKLPGSRYARSEWQPFFERLVDRVEATPGIKGVGAVSDLPMSSVGLGFQMEFTVLGLDAVTPTARPNADFRLVIPGYFEAMGMDMVQGRDFDRLDATSDRRVGIVNETLAHRYFENLDPVGQSVRLDMLDELEIEIVGVVSDIRHGGLQSKYQSEIYLPYGQLTTADMHIVVRSDLGTAAMASAVGDVLVNMDDQLALSTVDSISALLWQSVAQPRFNTALLSGLALCTTLLAIVGTYGIVAYSVTQRTAEIGVRMALGADSVATTTMIVRHALAIVVTGTALGVAGALGATRLLSQSLYQVQPTDPATYATVVVGAVVVAVVAAWIPARRATRIDPATALRDSF